MPAKKETEPAALVDLVVAVDTHEHGGKKVAKGDTIKVTPAQKEWLEKLWSVKPAA